MEAYSVPWETRTLFMCGYIMYIDVDGHIYVCSALLFKNSCSSELYSYLYWSPCTRCGRKVMKLATLCTNRQCCCLPLHMAVRLTPAVVQYKFELATVATRFLRASEVKLCLWGALRKGTGKSLSKVVPSNFV